MREGKESSLCTLLGADYIMTKGGGRGERRFPSTHLLCGLLVLSPGAALKRKHKRCGEPLPQS